MTDYDKRTGASGTMRIRDYGGTVDYWILCSDGSTRASAFSWSGNINGVGVGGTVNLPAGFRERLLGSWWVGADSWAFFDIPASGTSGLGGPTHHEAWIARYTPPPIPSATPPPDPVRWMAPADKLTPSSMAIHFGYWPSGDGGSPLTAYELQYATEPGYAAPVARAYPATSNGEEVLDNLQPGTTYYKRMRAVNAIGPGPWGATQATTTPGGWQISDGSNFTTWVVDVSNGAQWVRQVSEVSDGTAWRVTG